MSFPPVIIYTTKTCGYCRATKAFFAKHNVPFTEVDVGSDREKAREMIEVSGQMGVPVILIGEKGSEHIVIGYDEMQLKQLLGI